MTTKHNFVQWYMKLDNKVDWQTFILLALKLHLSDKNQIPTRIVMNLKDIGFLGKNRGVVFQGHKILVDTVRNCPIYNVQFHLD